VSARQVNEERDQDRVHDLFEMFEQQKQIMFHQQRSIYRWLSQYVVGKTVVEAGCGTGLGTAMLERRAAKILGTDKLQRNVDFARCVYPWIDFGVWDLNDRSYLRADVAVAVECVEHVRDTQAAIEHLIAVVSPANGTCWITLPNGNTKPRPPENPYHVFEPTPQEMIGMVHAVNTCWAVRIRDWESWIVQSETTTKDPLVYEVYWR